MSSVSNAADDKSCDAGNDLGEIWLEVVLPRLARLLRSLLLDSNQVEDILGDVYVRIWRLYWHADQFHWFRALIATGKRDVAIEELYAYSKKAAVRETFNCFKRKKRLAVQLDIEIESPEAPPDLLAMRREQTDIRLRRFSDVLATLSDRHRCVLLLSLEYPNYNELAAAMGMSVITLKPLLHRARTALARTGVQLYGESQE
jgi:DNA-directed RNA polymerase specialized sigma24 family protein